MLCVVRTDMRRVDNVAVELVDAGNLRAAGNNVLAGCGTARGLQRSP